MKTAIVSGAIANKCFNGGNAWTRLQWVLGLKRLGFRVYFVEQIAGADCVSVSGANVGFEDCVNRAYLRRIAESFGLRGSMALVSSDLSGSDGVTYDELVTAAESADLLVNLSGHLTLDDLKRGPRVKVYFDDDPGYTQFWHAAGSTAARLEGHDFFYTVGTNIGRPECPIPTGGIAWRRARPVVVLEQWPVSVAADRNCFTTLASWRGPYGPVEHAGRTYGQKVHEFRKFLEMPARTKRSFEIALAIDPEETRDLEALKRNGWKLADPREVAADPHAYRRYIQRSGAEFSAAQGIYVQTASGWFSDRTACYLASGKPALVQDTGLARDYPVGEGLLTFRSLDEAVAGAERIGRDYEHHSAAARRLAESHFDSDKNLGCLLEEVGIAA